MQLSEVEVEELTIKQASELTGRPVSSIRWQINNHGLVARKLGRDWLVSVIYDGDTPVFMYRVQDRDT